MYTPLSRWLERLLKVPPAPSAPHGDETSTRVFRASPRYYLYRLIEWAISRLAMLLSLFAAFGGLVAMPGEAPALLEAGFWIAGIGFALQSVLSYVALRLDYEKRWYLVTNRSLRIRQGVLLVSEMTISFANIQNIAISQGPLQRLLGIYDLRVDTAGGAGVPAKGARGAHSLHTAFFQGVDNAERIRSLMQERLRSLKDAGLGDTDDPLESHSSSGLLPPPSALDSVQLLREIRAEAAALATELAQSEQAR